MATINTNYQKLASGYLFPEIARRTSAWQKTHPGVPVLRLGIGNTTEALPEAVCNAMREKIEALSDRTTYTGYGDEQGDAYLREALVLYYRRYGVELESPEFIGRLELLGRGVIAGKHDLPAGNAASLCKLKLRQGRAVCTKPLLGQELQEGRVGTSFYRIVIAKTGCPGKEFLEIPCMLDHRFLIVHIERSWKLAGQLQHITMADR